MSLDRRFCKVDPGGTWIVLVPSEDEACWPAGLETYFGGVVAVTNLHLDDLEAVSREMCRRVSRIISPPAVTAEAHHHEADCEGTEHQEVCVHRFTLVEREAATIRY